MPLPACRAELRDRLATRSRCVPPTEGRSAGGSSLFPGFDEGYSYVRTTHCDFGGGSLIADKPSPRARVNEKVPISKMTKVFVDGDLHGQSQATTTQPATPSTAVASLPEGPA